MSVAPADLPAHGLDLNASVLAKFEARFGVAWADALAAGTLVNLAGARAALPAGTPALEIERMPVRIYIFSWPDSSLPLPSFAHRRSLRVFLLL